MFLKGNNAIGFFLLCVGCLGFLGGCEATKHTSVMSSEDLRAQGQESAVQGQRSAVQGQRSANSENLPSVDQKLSSRSKLGDDGLSSFDGQESARVLTPSDSALALPPQPNLGDDASSYHAGGEIEGGLSSLDGEEFVRAITPTEGDGGLNSYDVQESVRSLTPSDLMPEVRSGLESMEQGNGAKDMASDRKETMRSLSPSDMIGRGAKQGDSNLADVFFDFDQSLIRPEYAMLLEENAISLKGQYRTLSVLIEGHCDERGTVDYNLELGKRRAQSVKNYLIDLGVLSSRVQIISYGKERPFCTESARHCWQKNRRGHFVLQ